MNICNEPIVGRLGPALVAAAVIGWLAGSWILFTVAMILLLVLKNN